MPNLELFQGSFVAAVLIGGCFPLLFASFLNTIIYSHTLQIVNIFWLFEWLFLVLKIVLITIRYQKQLSWTGLKLKIINAVNWWIRGNGLDNWINRNCILIIPLIILVDICSLADWPTFHSKSIFRIYLGNNTSGFLPWSQYNFNLRPLRILKRMVLM